MRTEADFDNRYTYDTTVKSTAFDADQAGMLETYGDDLNLVLKINKKTPKRVWTMVDADDGMYLLQGYHLVNRVYYVITNEEAVSEDEEYLIDSYDEDDDIPPTSSFIDE